MCFSFERVNNTYLSNNIFPIFSFSYFCPLGQFYRLHFSVDLTHVFALMHILLGAEKVRKFLHLISPNSQNERAFSILQNVRRIRRLRRGLRNLFYFQQERVEPINLVRKGHMKD